MNGDEFDRLIDRALAGRARRNQLRQRTAITPIDATHIEIAGRRLVNFASNDYLGLSRHPRVRAAAIAAALLCGTGSGASPLISGYTDLHAALEQDLAAWKGSESALLLPSGYQANLAAIQAATAIAAGAAAADESGEESVVKPIAAGKGGAPLRVLVDKLVHASIIDAVRLSGAASRVFPHNRFEKLRRLLSDGGDRFVNLVATESIFSMDGDAANLTALAELRKEFPFMWLLDDAHGSGITGPAGAGPAAAAGIRPDISIVTFSKSMGCGGGAICASKKFCDAVVNFSRAYIYSTSIAPPVVGAVREALRVMRDEPQRATRLRDITRHVRQKLREMSLRVPDGDSPIIPIIMGTEEAALAASRALADAGIYVPAVRPPTVAPGASRLRITLCCEHTDQEIERLLESLQVTMRS